MKMFSLSPTDFNEWRDFARGLLHEGAAPECVSWQNSPQVGLFVEEPPRPSYGRVANVECEVGGESEGSRNVIKRFDVPATFINLAKQAACFIDADKPRNKWAVLYSLLWRITHVNKHTLALKTDPEVQALYAMCKAVNRDMHKMKAFVRFQSSFSSSDGTLLADEHGIEQLLSTERSNSKQFSTEKPSIENRYTERVAEEYFTAWFEPAHSIVEAIAPFFVKRFTGMSWSILTPHGCAHWNQKQLKISAGTVRPHIPQDQYEVFWRGYYRSIFNPARLKEKAMMSEMPKKYWQYLPEASCIKELTRNAGSSMDDMITADTTNSERMRQQSSAIKRVQNRLRADNQQ